MNSANLAQKHGPSSGPSTWPKVLALNSARTILGIRTCMAIRCIVQCTLLLYRTMYRTRMYQDSLQRIRGASNVDVSDGILRVDTVTDEGCGLGEALPGDHRERQRTRDMVGSSLVGEWHCTIPTINNPTEHITPRTTPTPGKPNATSTRCSGIKLDLISDPE